MRIPRWTKPDLQFLDRLDISACEYSFRSPDGSTIYIGLICDAVTHAIPEGRGLDYDRFDAGLTQRYDLSGIRPQGEHQEATLTSNAQTVEAVQKAPVNSYYR